MAIRRDARMSGKGAGPQRVTAVEIGLTAVRAVEVEITGASARLLKRGTAALPAACWDEPGLRDTLAQAIRLSLAGAGIAGGKVVAGVPRRLVTLKYARLPHAAPEMIRGMVQFEAQQYVPFPLEEAVLGHEIVSDEGEEMTTVMIIAARRQLIDDILAAFDTAGVEVTRVTVSSVGLAEHAQTDPLPVALLEVLPGAMDLAVVSDGRLIFSRAATVGRNGSANGMDAAAVSHALAGEVARSLAAFQTEHRGKVVSSLMLSGAGAEIAGAEDTLQSLLGIPVGRVRSPLIPPGDSEAVAYATPIGLAASPDSADLNLIPRSRAEQKEATRRRMQGIAMLAVAGAAAVAAALFVTRTLADQRAESNLALRENQRVETAQKVVNKTKADHERVTKMFQTVTTGLNRQRPLVDVLKAISDSVPKAGGIYLTQLSIERGGPLQIHGNARTETAATDLVIALQGSGEFSDVRLGYLGDAQADTAASGPAAPGASAPARPKPGENMSFLVTCRIKGDEAPRPGRDGAVAGFVPGPTAGKSGSRSEQTAAETRAAQQSAAKRGAP